MNDAQTFLASYFFLQAIVGCGGIYVIFFTAKKFNHELNYALSSRKLWQITLVAIIGLFVLLFSGYLTILPTLIFAERMHRM